jgi:hypothetical protein
MVEVRMRQEYMPDRVQITEFEVTNPGSRVDQNIVIDEHGRSSGPGADAPATSKNSYTHTVGVLLKPD